jgi:predicted RecA/RadA family phage recombinase
MTTAQNNVSYQWAPQLQYSVLTDGSNDINQGDLVYFDTVTKAVKVLDSDAHGAALAGVAGESSYLNLYGTKKYTDSGTIVVLTKGIFSFNTTNGDTLNDGDAVYLGADQQTVTNTAGGMTHAVGYVKLRPGQGAVAGGAGVKIDVLVVAQFPVAAGL